MKPVFIKNLENGFNTAYIDKNYSSNLAYKPQFISNNYKEGRKVLSSIEDELLSCKEFFISVAFITMGGVTPLLQTLKELERRHIPGKILTTDYQNFSEPRALRKLAELSNITLKMYRTDEAQEGFHTKGYIFKNEELYRIIVGSSNLTLSALTKNREWNTRVVSTDQGEYVEDLMEEFTDLWDSKYAVAFDDFIDEYSLNYRVIQKQRKIAKQAQIPSLEQYKLQPNSMQLGFIANLDKIQKSGESKALLISATGTGKTYASAFALREEAVKKVLFLVHREQIAKQAIASYKKVFGNTRTFGLLSGNSKDFDTDYLFSTMQMMAKPEILSKFQRDEFETIIIDEYDIIGQVRRRPILKAS
ncbi:MAG: DEAD/DEAH box helicase family protein [Mediterraneibacter sp.]